MPYVAEQPDPDSLIATSPEGVRAYAKDAVDRFPLYRGIKLMSDRPLFAGRKTAHIQWIVHQGRFRRGGDS